jgi:two-component sensor histidine kinase
MPKEFDNQITEFIDALIIELARGGDLFSIGEAVVQIGSKLIGAEGCSLYLVRGDEIELTHSTFLSNTDYIARRKAISSKQGAGLTSWVAATGQLLRFSDGAYRAHPAWAGEVNHLQFLPSKSTQSLLIVPIVDFNRTILGVITLENKKTPTGITNFNEEDTDRLIKLAVTLAKALKSAGMYVSAKEWEHFGLEDDLHDLVNWYHSGVVLWIDAIDEWLKRGEIDKVKELMPQLRSHAYSTVNELKTIHTNLMSAALEAYSLSESLSRMVSAWMRRITPKYNEEMKIKLSCPENLDIPVPIRNTLVRIASLAISNALQHSGIIENPKVIVEIQVETKKNKLVLTVSDNGQGAEKLTEGYGIARMNQLTKRFSLSWGNKAELSIRTGTNKGTRVNLTVEIDESWRKR